MVSCPHIVNILHVEFPIITITTHNGILHLHDVYRQPVSGLELFSLKCTVPGWSRSVSERNLDSMSWLVFAMFVPEDTDLDVSVKED